MQKVAKERLAVFKPAKMTPPGPADLESLPYLHYLMQLRENKLFSDLGMKLMKVKLSFDALIIGDQVFSPYICSLIQTSLRPCRRVKPACSTRGCCRSRMPSRPRLVPSPNDSSRSVSPPPSNRHTSPFVPSSLNSITSTSSTSSRRIWGQCHV